MFVIVNAWYNLTPIQAELPLPEKIALTMKDAGVSVTVTSLSDVLAFGIGATTVSELYHMHSNYMYKEQG